MKIISPARAKFVTVLFWLTCSCFSQSLTQQETAYFNKKEDSLVKLQNLTFFSKTDSLRLRSNAKFMAMLDEVLLNQLSYYYPFDSLKEISRLYAGGQKVRIITWNLERPDGTFQYFGFLQSKNPKSNSFDLYPLKDKSLTIKNPELFVGDNNSWFGMLYYNIINCKGYYILLGWDGNDKTVTRKFIEVLSFKKDGTPVFGKDVFKFPRKNPKRIMFEYSSKVVMSMRYNPESQAIIFDHLSAKDEFSTGMPQYSGPDFSFDAFVFKHHRWYYLEDVDTKNPRNKNDRAGRNSGKEKPLYVPK